MVKRITDHNDPEHINISRYSNSTLGKKLSLGHKFTFNTIIGKIGAIRNAMNAFSKLNYPDEFLSKTNFSSKDIERINKLPDLKIPNYWGAIAYIIMERVAQDTDLIKLFKNTPANVFFTSYKVISNKRFNTVTYKYDFYDDMDMYCEIINDIHTMILNDTFVFENDIVKINKFLTKYKNIPEVSILAKTKWINDQI